MSAIELWVLPLHPRADDEHLLDARERARFDRLRVDAKRDQFLAAQAGLRRLLAARLAIGPEEVVFAYGPHGKPALPAAPDLGFNLSHSGELAIVGIAPGVEIGVDLEWLGRDRPFARLARRYFDPAEADWLEALPEVDVRSAFYRIWTLKEAYLKAIGTGLTVPPSSFRIDLAADPPLLARSHDGSSAGRWRLAPLQGGDGYAAAICHDGGSRDVVVRPAPGW